MNAEDLQGLSCVIPDSHSTDSDRIEFIGRMLLEIALQLSTLNQGLRKGDYAIETRVVEP